MRTGTLHLAIAAECLSVAAVLYVIGWGPALAIGFVFVAARALDLAGSRAWKVTVFWSSVSIALGQVCIALDLVRTYVPVPWCTGLRVWVPWETGL